MAEGGSRKISDYGWCFNESCEIDYPRRHNFNFQEVVTGKPFAAIENIASDRQKY